MKILLVTFEFPPQKGGVENYYYNLIKNIKNVDFVVLTLPQKDADKFDSQQSFKIIRKSLLYRFFWPRWFKMYFLIKKVVKKEGIDLIWVGDVLPVGSACFLLKYFHKVPYFISTHGMDIMLPQKSIRKERLMLKVLRNAGFITANSQFTKKQLMNLSIDEEKIEVVYPCANISKNQLIKESINQINEIRDKLKLKDKKILLTVGRLVERKGQDMIIKVMPKLLKQFPNLVYLIVGDGPAKSNFQFLISNFQLRDKVIILDNISDQELPIYYQLADLFVMPARDIKGDVEGFGIVYLEANSFGLPVVAGKSGGVHEAVVNGQTGLLVDPADENDIIQKIEKLLSDKDLYQKLSENGMVRVEKEFRWERQADKLIERIKKKFQELSFQVSRKY